MRSLLLLFGLALPWMPHLYAQEGATTTTTTTDNTVPKSTPAASVFSTTATTAIPGVNPGDLTTDSEGCYLYKPLDDPEVGLKLCDVSGAQDVFLYEGASFMWVNGTLSNLGTVSICNIEFDSSVLSGVLLTVPFDILSRPGDDPLVPGDTLTFNFLLPISLEPVDPKVPEAADLYLADSWTKCKAKTATPTEPPTQPSTTKTTTPPATSSPKFSKPSTTTNTPSANNAPTGSTVTVPDAVGVGAGEASASKEDTTKKGAGATSPAPGLRPLSLVLSAVVIGFVTLVVIL